MTRWFRYFKDLPKNAKYLDVFKTVIDEQKEDGEVVASHLEYLYEVRERKILFFIR